MNKKLLIAICCVCVLIAIFVFTKVTTSTTKVVTPPTSEVSSSIVVKRIQAKRAKAQAKKRCGCCSKQKLRVRTSKSTQ